MPLSAIKSMADKAGVPIDRAEASWELAKKRAEEQGQKDNYAYIMAIFKKQLRVEEYIITRK
jgi:hypothetical protein